MRRQNDSIVRASLLVATMSIIGKIVGFLREIVIADYFGSSWKTDAFFFAQKMPGMIFPSVCNSFSTAFLTLYVKKKIDEGERESNKFATSALIGGLVIALILSVVAIIIAPVVVGVFAPGFENEQKNLAIVLTRISMSAFTFSMLLHLVSAILNSNKAFFKSQIIALFYNIFVIVVTIVLGRNQDVDQLMWTVIIGHFLQAVLAFNLAKKYYNLCFDIRSLLPNNKEVLIIALPIIISMGLESLNQIVDQFLGSLLSEGTISALSYCNSLNTIVTGVFITSLSTVLYPNLTEKIAIGDRKSFCRIITNSIENMSCILLPISVIACICSSDIVRIVYQRGCFDQVATFYTSEALKYYAWMYVFLAFQNISIRAFYSMNDTKTPLILSGFAVLLNSVISFFASKLIGIGGLALGTTVSTCIASIALLIGLKKINHDLNIGKSVICFIKCSVASVLMLIFVSFLEREMRVFMSIFKLVYVTILGFVMYFAVLLLLRCDPAVMIIQTIRKKIQLYHRKDKGR